jgi:hypothetical protein
MLAEAKANVGEDVNIKFTDDWNLIQDLIKKEEFKVSLLTMNSALHEVYTYSTSKQYKKFWSQAFRSRFTYISIRDMMMSEKDYKHNLDFDEIDRIKKIILEKEHGEEKLESFQDIYGEIVSQGELIHFFMKDDFWHNWEREVNENYLGITKEEFFKKINSAGGQNYKVEYYKPFTLTYLKNKVKKDYDFDITVPTHIKLLLKLK